MHIQVNGQRFEVDEDWRDETLLSVLREQWGLVGAKYGCGQGQCGACTVLIDGQAVRSCVVPVGSAADGATVTIEGLASGEGLHPLQQAWLDEAVPQCGYCQAGQIMNAAALLRQNPNPDDDAIDAAMDGNLCRCGTYDRIRKAIKRVATSSADVRSGS